MATNKYRLASLVLSVTLAYSAPSRAACDGCVVNAVGAASSAITGSIALWIGKLAGVVESTSKAEMDTMGRVQQGVSETIIKVDHDREESNIIRRAQSSPDPCSTGAILRHVSTVTAAQAKAAASYRRGSGYGGGSYRPANASLDKRVNDPGMTPGTAGALSAQVHSTDYCSDAQANGLKLLGTQVCARQSNYPDADIQAETLFYGAKRKGATYTGQNLVFGREQIDAAQAYIANTTDPLPAQAVSPAQANTPEGKLYHAMWLAAKARIDAADINKREILAARTPVADGKVMLDALKNSGSTEDFGRASNQFYLENKDRYGFENGVSPMALLDFDVERRHSNKEWVKAVFAASPEAIAKEQAQMQALQLHLQMKQVYQNERIIALLADMVSTSTRAEMDARLQAQYSLIQNRR